MVLVVGGAGFVGSHVANALRAKKVPHAVVDNLENGHASAAGDSRLIRADIRDPDSLRQGFSEPVEAVMIFSGYISVGESYRDPLKYYDNNVRGVIELLRCAIRAGTHKFVFSSSSAVYGEPDAIPIEEDHPKRPTNPYGETKLAVENALRWCAKAHGIRAVSLRYFNAAGADPDGLLGEDHDPEEHLIPLAIDAAFGRRDRLVVFGDDYDTPDGSCIRDYVHVADLADAHIDALRFLEENSGAHEFNLGSGQGFSVKQVLNVVSDVCGRQVPFEVGPRRLGDPARLVASNARAKTALGWVPKFPDLETIVAHAAAWRERNPHGYADKLTR